MKLYQIIRDRALKTRNAERYFIYCLNSREKPVDFELYKEGYSKIFQTDLTEERFEKMFRGKEK